MGHHPPLAQVQPQGEWRCRTSASANANHTVARLSRRCLVRSRVSHSRPVPLGTLSNRLARRVNREMTSAAERLTATLNLDFGPIGLAFTDTPPEGIPGPGPVAPSACSFWRRAEQGVFYAAAADHFNCAVGSMVMGFALPDEVQAALGGLVESMCACGYLDEEEAAKIPAVTPSSQGIVYGPLASLPVPADVILLWLTPAQSMILNEAAGGAKWTSGLVSVSGRPACAAIPIARAEGSPAMSLGCAGMRTFTGISGNYLLGAIPGTAADSLVAALESTVAANDSMLAFYQGRLAELEPSE